MARIISLLLLSLLWLPIKGWAASNQLTWIKCQGTKSTITSYGFAMEMPESEQKDMKPIIYATDGIENLYVYNDENKTLNEPSEFNGSTTKVKDAKKEISFSERYIHETVEGTSDGYRVKVIIKLDRISGISKMVIEAPDMWTAQKFDFDLMCKKINPLDTVNEKKF